MAQEYLTVEGSINSFIDQLLLPGRPYFDGKLDPEGILVHLSATGVTLMGTIAGNILRKQKTTDWQKIGYFASRGYASIILGLASYQLFIPLLKKCWTSTFNLLTGGISFLLIALFYMIIDHWGFQSWAFYFRVIGMNSIFVYLFTRMVNTTGLSQFFVGWITKPLGESTDKYPQLLEAWHLFG